MFSKTTTITFLVRILIALCTRTFFQPDEYFQALEPAHSIIFGYGHLTWEWATEQPIRSLLYPAVNVPMYWFLKVTGLDSWDTLVILGPRFIHGTLAAFTDIALCELTRKTIGERYVSTAFFLSITSFFHALSLSRSLSNSLETSLTTIALSMYPWHSTTPLDASTLRIRVRSMLFFASLACAIRPTNAVIWMYLIPTLLWRLRDRKDALFGVLINAALTGSTTLGIMFILDWLYYGRPVFTPLNFLRTNLSGVSLFYGSNPWHYYLAQALPILCTTSLPFALHGLWAAQNTPLTTLRGLVLWTIGVYSLAGHKEWRFIHPVLPVLHLFAAKSLVDTFSSRTSAHNKNNTIVQKRILFFHSLNIPVSVYIALFYCSAPISVMSYIRSLPPQDMAGSIGFLMPCHSTPGHAYLHRPQLAEPLRMWTLTCEPPLRNQNLSTYKDQTTVFFAEPLQYLKERFPEQVDPVFPSGTSRHLSNSVWSYEWPLHLVFFGALLEKEGVRELLEEKGYKEVWRKGRSWEGDIDERKGGVRVWKWVAGEMQNHG
ncbi:glycosyltransferase family 22 protein [Moniliophthora roreri MCA 2997]|uniref:Mannosyltransferase n=1 Tax=Moniliophthora roreri (strain MCA 2997) TaxID=1381753 RepID=V2XVA9_MONRO|nr:glycosyltransferase family 22 protein [Moniliophthora roreri MCA 2997]